MLTVICNSSPLINLAIIGKLDLLKKYWGKIHIPEAVWQEVVIDGRGNEEVDDIKKAEWIIVEKVTNQNLVVALEQDLDKGESEAIALAVEKKADILIIDETDAREVADIYEINKTGVLGVLILAKLRNDITSLKQEIKNLKTKANFWLKDSLVKKALKKAGEL